MDEEPPTGTWLDRTAERVALAALAAIAFFLPFHAIGFHAVTGITRFHPGDIAAMLGLPAIVWVVWRRRNEVVRRPIVVAWTALVVVRILAALGTASPRAELSSMARHALSVVVVAGAAGLAIDAASRRALVRWLIVGGVLATVLALGGYAVMVLGGRVEEGVNPFVYQGRNPLFDGWPRLSGTFGHSQQHMGEYLVVLLAFAATGIDSASKGRRRWLRPTGAVSVGLALLLTFSFAWVGAAIVAAGVLACAYARSARVRCLAAVAAVLALAAATWVMNVGLPDPEAPARSRTFGSCEELDVEHQVTVATRARPMRCRSESISRPYAAPLTLYLDAKTTALRLFELHPWTGTGEVQYAAAAERFSGQVGEALNRWQYDSPHCAYLQVLAGSGAFAGIALLALIVAVWFARPSPAPGEVASQALTLGPWLAVIALLAIGVNIDVLGQRHLWLALGLAALPAGFRASPSGQPRSLDGEGPTPPEGPA